MPISSPTLRERIALAPATLDDIAQARALFDATLPLRYPPAFYSDIERALEPRVDGAPPPQFLVSVAHLDGDVVAAAVVAVVPHDTAMARGGPLPCAILTPESAEGAAAACVLMLAVAPSVRRYGVGSELLAHCLGVAVEGDTRIRVAFLHALARDARVTRFCTSSNFSRVGVLPRHFRLASGEYADATLFACPLSDDAVLAEYVVPSGGTSPADLSSNPTRVVEVPFPPLWVQRTCGNAYIAPIIALFFLALLARAFAAISAFSRGSSEGSEGVSTHSSSGVTFEL